MTAVLYADAAVAAIVLLLALRNLNAITRATSHWVRVANVLLAIAAFAIVIAGAYPDVAAEVRAGGHAVALSAICMLMCCGRRRADRAAT